VGCVPSPCELNSNCSDEVMIRNPIFIFRWLFLWKFQNYTADFIQALCWAICSGTGSLIPYFYPSKAISLEILQSRRRFITRTASNLSSMLLTYDLDLHTCMKPKNFVKNQLFFWLWSYIDVQGISRGVQRNTGNRGKSTAVLFLTGKYSW
jgi:hypothetical protein